jgi:hypothetical protein
MGVMPLFLNEVLALDQETEAICVRGEQGNEMRITGQRRLLAPQHLKSSSDRTVPFVES